MVESEYKDKKDRYQKERTEFNSIHFYYYAESTARWRITETAQHRHALNKGNKQDTSQIKQTENVNH